MYRFILVTVLAISAQITNAQEWETVLPDLEYYKSYTIYETQDQITLASVDTLLYVIDANGSITDTYSFDWGGLGRSIIFNSTRIYAIRNFNYGTSIFRYNHQAQLLDTLVLKLDGNFSFYNATLADDGTITAVVYESDERDMYAAKFDSTGQQVNQNLVAQFGTRPRSIEMRKDGGFICYDASSKNNLFYLDENLEVTASEIDDHLIADLKVTEDNRIFLVGDQTEFDTYFIIEIDDDSNIINSNYFTSQDIGNAQGWVDHLAINDGRLSMTLSDFESHGILTLICFDDDLNMQSFNSVNVDRNSNGYGWAPISNIIPNQSGGFTLGHGVENANGDTYPLIIKTGDDCFLGNDIVLSYSEILLDAQRLKQSVLLNWKIDIHDEISHVNIQHGQTTKQLESIYEISQKDLENELVEYTHYDPFLGSNYYRLEIHTVNGEIFYSKFKHIKLENSDLSIYPNPSNNILNLESTELVLELSIINMQGQIVKTINEINDAEMVISLNDYQAGIYYLSILTKKGVELISFVKI